MDTTTEHRICAAGVVGGHVVSTHITHITERITLMSTGWIIAAVVAVVGALGIGGAVAKKRRA